MAFVFCTLFGSSMADPVEATNLQFSSFLFYFLWKQNNIRHPIFIDFLLKLFLSCNDSFQNFSVSGMLRIFYILASPFVMINVMNCWLCIRNEISRLSFVSFPLIVYLSCKLMKNLWSAEMCLMTSKECNFHCPSKPSQFEDRILPENPSCVANYNFLSDPFTMRTQVSLVNKLYGYTGVQYLISKALQISGLKILNFGKKKTNGRS